MRGLTAFLIAFFFANDIDICDTQKMTQTRKGTKKSLKQAVPQKSLIGDSETEFNAQSV